MKKVIFILLLIFPFLVSAKNPEELTLKWGKDCKNNPELTCENRSLIDETDDNLLFATQSGVFEILEKGTGKVLKTSDTYKDMEKFGENYLAVSYIESETEEKVFTSKFVLLDQELNVIKEKEITNEIRYFSRIEYVNDEVLVYDNGGNKYNIDENLNLKYEHVRSDGKYTIFFETGSYSSCQVILFDKNHNIIKINKLNDFSYKWNAYYVRIDDYFITYHYDFHYDEKLHAYVSVYDFYLIDLNTDIIDHQKFEGLISYKDLRVGSNNQAYINYAEGRQSEDYSSYRIDISSKTIKFVLEEEPEKNNSFVDVSDRYIFSNMLNEEFDSGSFWFDYKKNLNDEFVLYLRFSDENKKDMIRYYDKNKKLIYSKSADETLLSIYGIYDIFMWNDKNLGMLQVQDNKILVLFYDENMNLLSKLDTKYTVGDYDDGEVKILKEGLYVKLSRTIETPCGIADDISNNSSMRGFPSSAGGCAYYSNLSHLYYEYPFNISVKTDGNGKVVSSKEKSLDGEEISFEIVPNEGYDIDSIKVIDSYGDIIEFNDNKFTMPAADVVIEVSFVKQHVEEKNPETSDYIVMIGVSVLVISVFCYLSFVKKSEFLN